MHGNLDMQGNTLQNCNIEENSLLNCDINDCNINDCNIDPNGCSVNGGMNGECLLLTPGAINANGTINISNVRRVQIQNGFIVST